MKPHHDISDPNVVKALAHPLRVRILSILEQRQASPTEIADEIDAPLGTVSYHVRILLGLELIKLVRETPRRGAIEHHYEVVRRPRITDDAWRNVPQIVKRTMVDAALDEVGEHVRVSAHAGGFDLPDAHLTRNPVRVDELGWHQLSRELAKLVSRIEEIESKSRDRIARSGHAEDREAAVVLMLFGSTQPGSAGDKTAKKTRARSRRARSTAHS